jgi:TusA-related sulfurtransferase
MRILTECKADAKADLVYLACPMHLLEPMELIKDLELGQVLEILTDYDGAGRYPGLVCQPRARIYGHQ